MTSPYALPTPFRSVSGPEAGRRVPHAEPPLSAVLLDPLHLCEPTSLNTLRFSLHGLQPAPRWSVAPSAAGDEAACRQVPSPQLTSSGPASAIADTGCDQDPGHGRARVDTPLPQPHSCCSEARRRCITSRRSTSWCPTRRSGWASSSRGKGVPDQVRCPAGAPLGQCRARLRRGVGGMRPPARRPCPRRGPARSPRCGGRSALACEV